MLCHFLAVLLVPLLLFKPVLSIPVLLLCVYLLLTWLANVTYSSTPKVPLQKSSGARDGTIALQKAKQPASA